MKLRKLLGLVLSTTLIVGAFAGCTGSETSSEKPASSEATSTSTATSSEAEAAPEATDDKTYKIGITFSDLSNPVWAELVQEAERYGKEKNLAVTYVDAQSDTVKQVTQIENFIQNEMDAIIVCAVEANSITDVTKQARDAGIYVVSYTQIIENADTQYLVDAYNTGYACGKRAADWINENYADEAEVQWGLMDLPIFPEIIDRANGIKAGIEENAPNAKLVATASALTAEEGLKNAENFLQANPDLKVIACIGGGGSTGGNEGMKAAGITDFNSAGLFGIDATEEEILNIIKGDPQKSSISLGGGKAHARSLIDLASTLLNGGTCDPEVYMPIQVVDSANAQEYYDEMYGVK